MVKTANTATVTVGKSAISAKAAVKRRCRRDPADFALRAAIIRATRPNTIDARNIT